MPPNEAVVSKLTWVVHFTQENMPKQEVVVANVARKYGPISWNTTPAALSIGTRDVFWVDDEQGNRVKTQPLPRCLSRSTFHERIGGGHTQSVGPGQRPAAPHPPACGSNRASSTTRIHRRTVHKGHHGSRPPLQSEGHGVAIPNLVEYVVLMVASGPPRPRRYQATHEYWLKTAKPGSTALKSVAPKKRP